MLTVASNTRQMLKVACWQVTKCNLLDCKTTTRIKSQLQNNFAIHLERIQWIQSIQIQLLFIIFMLTSAFIFLNYVFFAGNLYIKSSLNCIKYNTYVGECYKTKIQQILRMFPQFSGQNGYFLTVRIMLKIWHFSLRQCCLKVYEYI